MSELENLGYGSDSRIPTLLSDYKRIDHKLKNIHLWNEFNNGTINIEEESRKLLIQLLYIKKGDII